MTTSTGVIVEYDKDGLKRTYNKGRNSLWAQSLLVDTISDGWMDHWDDVLDEVRGDLEIFFKRPVNLNFTLQ